VGDAGSAEIHEVARSRHSPHTDALVKTIHNRHCSQFEQVAVLPTGHVSLIQTRELVCTAVTLSSDRLTCVGSQATLAITTSLSRPRRPHLGPRRAVVGPV